MDFLSSLSSFNILCITAPSNDICKVYKERCNILKKTLHCLKDCKIYCISDPKGYRIGSGGGTLNVLSYLNENNEDLSISKVLIIHSGGNSQRSFIHSVCGKAWSTLNGLIDNNNNYDNNDNIEIISTPMALLIKELMLFSINIPLGSCVVACSDVTLDILIENKYSLKTFPDGCSIVTVSESPITAKNHGVIVEGNVVTDEDELKICNIKHYLQKPSLESMKESGAIDSSSSLSLIDTGVVIFVGSGMKALLECLNNDIILKCTEKFINSNEVLRLELYSDILLAFRLSNGCLTKEQYYSLLNIDIKESKSLYEKAIEIIWDNLNNINLYSINIKRGSFNHLGTIEEQLNLMAVSTNPNPLQQHDEKLVKFTNKYSLNAVVSTRLPEINNIKGVICNSFLGGQSLQQSNSYSLIEHSLISSSLQVSSKTVLSHLMIKFDEDIIIKEGSMIQQIPLKGKAIDEQFVFVMFYWKDDIKIQFNDHNARIFSHTWNYFFEKTSTNCDEFWDPDSKDKSLWTARLFPIATSSETIQLILWLQDLNEFKESMVPVVNQWRQAKRMSMLELMTEGDASSMHLWQRYLTLIVKSKYSNIENHDTLIDTYSYCKRIILQVMDIHSNMLFACPAVLFMLCCQIISNDNTSENFSTTLLDLCRKFPDSNDSIISSVITYFDDFWVKIHSLSSNTCRLVLEYLESMVDNELKVVVANSLLSYAEQHVSKEFLPRVVFMIGWLIRNNNIKFNSFTFRQSSVDDIFTIIKQGLHDQNTLPSSSISSSSSCQIESLAQSIIYCQIQSSLDMKRLSFKREGRTTITKDIILTTAPVRIDIGGGWSDTPSICYEQGGSVLNVAVQVDNQRPVRCLSRAIHGIFQIKLHALKRSANQSVSGDSVTCTKFKDFLSVSDTSLSTSLLKAVIVVLEIIDKSQIENYRNIDDDLDTKMFSKSLEEKFNGGIEICCISDLPSGSGMGGSSVLAAVIIRSISDLLDLRVTSESLVYLVTQVEQVLSSGGGYQDQIGSIYPGFKICRSTSKLPLEISVQELPVTSRFTNLFEKRCFLIFTGQQRLAKNILISALRNFSLTSYPKEKCEIYSSYNTVSSLIRGAEQGCLLLSNHYNGSDNNSDDDCIDLLATILDNYFKLKVEMAPGTDPEHIRNILRFVRPICSGMSLCGAGAGGFAVVILKSTCTKDDLIKAVNEFNTINHISLTVHTVTVDTDGIKSKTFDSTLHANLEDYLFL